MTPHFGCLTTSCLAQEIPDLFLGIDRAQRLVPWTTVTMVKRRGLMLSVLQGGTLFWTQDHRLQSCSKKLVCLTVFVHFVAGTLPHLCSFLPPPPRTHTVSERYGCRFWWRQHQCEQALRFAVGRASLQAEYGRWSHYFSAQSRGVSSVLCRPTDWLCLTNWIQNKNKHFLIDMPLNFHYGKYCSVSRNENWKMKIVFLTGVTQDISASAAQMMYLFICLSSLSL